MAASVAANMEGFLALTSPTALKRSTSPLVAIRCCWISGSPG